MWQTNFNANKILSSASMAWNGILDSQDPSLQEMIYWLEIISVPFSLWIDLEMWNYYMNIFFLIVGIKFAPYPLNPTDDRSICLGPFGNGKFFIKYVGESQSRRSDSIS